MARTNLTIQTTARTGLEATYTAATVDGHAFDNTGKRVFLHVKNAAGVDTTITIDNPAVVDGLNVPDKTVVVTAGEERFIGPFGESYEQASGTTPAIAKSIKVNAAPQASVTYAAIKLGAPN